MNAHKDVADFLPHVVIEGVKFNLIQLDVCVDFGGRQFQMEFQNTQTREATNSTYYGLTDDYAGLIVPRQSALHKWLKDGFNLFAKEQEAAHE